MSLVQGMDGDLISVDRVSTDKLKQLRADMQDRLAGLVPTGDEYRWVEQEIDIVDEELEARHKEGDPDA